MELALAAISDATARASIKRGPSRGPSHQAAKPLAHSKAAVLLPGLSPLLSDRRTLLELREVRLSPSGNPTVSGLANLTSRDIAILMALDQYRYLDRQLLQDLFFEGPRSCQLRLRYLTSQDLVICWQAVLQPGRQPRPSVFLLSARGASLLGRVCQSPRGPFVWRAEHARTRAFHLDHDLGANGFFVALARASRALDGEGLYHWVGERTCRRVYEEEGQPGPIPDGWGRYLVPEGEVVFFLEWDRGTEQRRRLRMKVSRYDRYFRGRRDAAQNQVLFVVPSAARENEVRRVIRGTIEAGGEESCRFWTATVERLREMGVLGRIWISMDGMSEPVQLAALPRQRRSCRPAASSIGKPGWWERRPGGGEGA